MLLLLAVSASAALLFFFGLHMGISAGLDRFFLESSYLEHAEQKAVQNLQEYIDKQKLTPADKNLLTRWVRRQNIIYLEIYRDNRLLYLSNNADEETQLYEQESPFYHNGFYTLTFADGEAEAVLLGAFEYQFYMYALIGEILVSFLLFLALFVSGIRSGIRYIQTLREEIGIMEGGCLDHPVTVTGSDELSELAEGLEQLRLSLQQNIETEAALKQANHTLVTGIAHDLRTPLTALTMYVQILQSDVCKDEQKKAYYLEKIMAKASLMKELSDRLFEYNHVHENESEKPLAESRTMQGAFMDYLSEMAIYLEGQGFRIDAALEWRAVSLLVRMDYIARITDNLSSNLAKYADPAAPILIKTIYETPMAGIEIQNRIRKQSAAVESTKVGMKNVKQMMNQMNGTCQVEINQEFYWVQLLFPLNE